MLHACRYLTLSRDEGLNWGFIRGAWSSVGNLAVAQMQDFLNLGSEARMNVPSTMGDYNWSWRMLPGQLTEELADRIYQMTKLYGRAKSHVQ
jgi:4-alpha-glucanotransferase